MGTIRCRECGQPLGKDANFCRACGAGSAAPASSAGPPRNRAAIVAAVAILAIGAGAAVAILLAAGGGSTSTTTVIRGAAAPAGGPVAAGRYVQAGSFQTTSHAEAERRRLAGHGIEVEVVPSDGARELYPGFQVLLGGPFHSSAAAAAMVSSLRDDGVPSAFARNLTPAPEAPEPAAVAGRWTGRLERTSVERPNLDGPLPATLTIASGGATGSLELPALRCSVSLSLASSGGPALSYSGKPPCAGTGPLVVRPAGDELMLTLRSPGTDSFALGTFRRG